MLEVAEIVRSLQAKGVRFHAADERLTCDAPKGVIDEDIARTIKENKKGIIEFLLQNRASAGQVDRVEHVEGRRTGPLTFSEERLMFMEKLVYGVSSFNLPVPIKLVGKVRSDIFERCLQEIVDRHDILRTTFVIEKDTPVRIIHPALKVRLETVDCTARGAAADSDYTSLLLEVGKKSFDLSVPPLFKFMLIRINENESILFFDKPSIIWDGWSFDIFLSELDILYEAFSKGKPSPLPKLEIQYSDYAAWYTNRMQGREISGQIDYWRSKLPGQLPGLNLPYDFERTSSFTYQGQRKAFKIPAEKVGRLSRICGEENATLFLGFLTVFEILLSRYTNQQDILIGLPMWNRVRPEIENLIGHFVNNILFLNHIRPESNFRQLLNEIKSNFIEGFNNQEAPFEKIAEDLEIDHGGGGAPIYQVYFSYQDARNRPHKIGDLAIEQIYLFNSSAVTDLSFWLKESDVDMAGGIDYSAELFDERTIDQFFNHYLQLIDAVVKHPDASISGIPMLTEKESADLIVCDRTEIKAVGDKRIGSVFKETAGRYPDKVAVELDKTRLTYRQLDLLSDAFAGALKSGGDRAQSPVGLLMDPSIDMIIAMLGILKSGNHFVPMDPTLPRERLRHLVNDSNMSFAFTRKKYRAFCEEASIDCVCTDGAWEPGTEHGPAVRAGSANDLACLIYCPSPGGDPAGVEVSQASLLNLISGMQKTIGIAHDDIFLVASDLGHAIFTLEILLPLLTGSKIILAGGAGRDAVRSLKRKIKKSGPTVMHAPPSAWRRLIDAGWKGSKNLKILSGRERLPQDLGGELLTRCGELWNMFGTLETTFWSAAQKITATDQCGLLGRPVAHSRMYVLDDRLQQLPIGAAGNLYIGGPGVANGYWKRPDLMTGKFFADAFLKISNGSIYRTGDIAKFRRDGTLELLNRTDEQLKLNGNRVEPSEIERRMLQHAGVLQALVVPSQNGRVAPELIGYFCTQSGTPVAVDDLRSHLKQNLPDYMIPRHFIELEQLPLAAGGKVDRKRLPRTWPGASNARGDYVAPRNDVESRLAEIWEKILGKKPIGVKSNFFELGGHSFMAARMFAQIEKEFNKKMPLALLFQSPTIEALAEKLSRKDWKPNWSSLVPIQTAGTKTPLFLVHGAEGNVLIYRELSRYLGEDQPVYGLQSQGLSGEGNFPTTIEDMAKHYIKEIRAVSPEGPFHLGGYCLGGHIALEMASQLLSEGHKVGLLALFESYNFKDGITLSKYYRLIHKLQNLGFHLTNFLSINNQDKVKFFSRKFKTEYGRFVQRAAMVMSGKMKIFGTKSDSNSRRLPVVDVNHKAQQNYEPKVYNGQITLFRPQEFFAGRNDRFFGWGPIAKEGVDVRMLPYGPHAMFVEPFVRKLAAELEGCLEKGTL
jgi:amino acid adenylation domain-containing protein